MKLTTDLKNTITILQKAKTNYDSKCKDADSAQVAYLKAKQDGNTKPKKVQEVNHLNTIIKQQNHLKTTNEIYK